MHRTTNPGLKSCLAFLACLLLNACGPSYSPNTYASTAVQQANKVEQGTVVGVRKVDVSAPGTTGAAVGATAGGIAGSQVPASGVGQAFGALGGAVIGGVVGSSIEHAAGDTSAFEYIVKKTSGGDLLSVTQRDKQPLAVGAKVLVITGSQARIVPDYTVATNPEPAKPEPVMTAPAPPPVFDAPLPDLTPAAGQAGQGTAAAPLPSAPQIPGPQPPAPQIPGPQPLAPQPLAPQPPKPAEPLLQ